jgi:hypothetical protein
MVCTSGTVPPIQVCVYIHSVYQILLCFNSRDSCGTRGCLCVLWMRPKQAVRFGRSSQLWFNGQNLPQSRHSRSPPPRTHAPSLNRFVEAVDLRLTRSLLFFFFPFTKKPQTSSIQHCAPVRSLPFERETVILFPPQALEDGV